MERKLPGIYKNTIERDISNNKKMFYSLNKDINTIGDNKTLLKEYIFNIPVEIITYDKIINSKIVSKIGDHILTSNNQIIKLNDIKSIKRKDL